MRNHITVITTSRAFRIIFFLLLLLVLVFILYKIFGFGYIKAQNSTKNTVINIDDVPYLKSNETVKLRPGSYTVNAVSPKFNTTKRIKVSLFGTTNINAAENKWDYIEAVKSAISSDNNRLRLFDGQLMDEVWYSGLLIEGNLLPEMFVIKFDMGQWELACRGRDEKTCYKSQMPNKILEHAKSLILVASRSRG